MLVHVVLHAVIRIKVVQVMTLLVMGGCRHLDQLQRVVAAKVIVTINPGHRKIKIAILALRQWHPQDLEVREGASGSLTCVRCP